MDLNELKNLNMDDLKTKVLAFADKKTLIKSGITFGAIIPTTFLMTRGPRPMTVPSIIKLRPYDCFSFDEALK